MKKVVIFGAAGHTGKYLTRKMQSIADVELSVFVRNPAKFGEMDMTGVNILQGDALNAGDVRRAMDGQDVLLCSLEGDVLDKTADNRCRVSLAGQRDYLESRGVDTSAMKDADILRANTGSEVFLEADLTFCDAMEDLSLVISM